ncbi:hypothetical protein [Kitasatospora purpeofusca]|uniref:hypothetical protein n=1 Tax=Kitasatospora purpeofusca TaxID=67352 RepID=UPI0004C283C0|nr:hypothetical protein [Kitasatospora purpeofusca]
MNIDRQTLSMITVLSVLGAALAGLWAASSGTIPPANAAGVAYAVLASLLAKATGCSILVVLVRSPFRVVGAVLRAVGSLLLAFF